MIRTTGPLGASGGAGAVESFIVNVGDGPVRTCIACRQKAGRDELTRFVFRPDQHPAVVHDVSATLPGRGAWVHPAEKCLNKGLTTAAFARSFRTKITASDLPRPDTEPKENG